MVSDSLTLILPFFCVENIGCLLCLLYVFKYTLGAQWLSGRVLDSRLKGQGFEPHLCHCVVVLEQDTFILA